MEIFKIELRHSSGTVYISQKIRRLVFEKERYTPYTQVSLQLYEPHLPLGEYLWCRLYYGSQILHFGTIRSCTITQTAEGLVTTVNSRGFSAELLTNQPVPGMNLNVNLDTLFSNNIALPNVSHEQNTATVNYVYVKKNGSIWDALNAYGLKAYENLPYLRGANEIRLTAPTSAQTLDYSSLNVESYGYETDHTRMISHVHMADTEGSYDQYNGANSIAATRAIIRHKQIDFDMQWTSNPQKAVTSRLDFSNRAYLAKTLAYCGYSGEDLLDRVHSDSADFALANESISRLRVFTDNAGCIHTKLWMYHDSYCNS